MLISIMDVLSQASAKVQAGLGPVVNFMDNHGCIRITVGVAAFLAFMKIGCKSMKYILNLIFEG